MTVGHSIYSLFEMEKNWAGIQLFHFHESDPWINFFERALLWIPNNPQLRADIEKKILAEFSGIISCESSGLKLSERLWLSFKEKNEYIEVRLQPTAMRPWENADFDVVRIVDALLQPLQLPLLKKSPGYRTFFRGRVEEA